MVDPYNSVASTKRKMEQIKQNPNLKHYADRTNQWPTQTSKITQIPNQELWQYASSSLSKIEQYHDPRRASTVNEINGKLS